MPTLVVTDVKKNKTREVPIRDSKFSIGSGDENHLVLPRRNIAAQHCVIYYRDEQFYIRSMGDGTVVDGRSVDRDVVLHSGSQIEIGDFDMVFKSKRAGRRSRTSRDPDEGRDDRGRDDRQDRDRARRDLESGPIEDSDEPPRHRDEPDSDVDSDSDGGHRDAKPRGQRPKEKPKFAAEQKWADRDRKGAQPHGSGEQLNADEVEQKRTAKKSIHMKLLESKELKRVAMDQMADAETRMQTEKVVVGIVKEMARGGEIPGFINKRELVKEICDEALGLGPLEDLLADDTINEIMVNRWDRIYVEKQGVGMMLTDKQFSDDDQVVHVIRRIVSPLGRVVNEQTPLVDGRLPDGSRVNAVIPPLAVSGPSITIRKFSKDKLGIQDLVNFDSCTHAMGEFFELAVGEHKNMVISGGTGSGKTTLLNVVSSFISTKDRIVTVEDVSELNLPQDHVVTLEAKAPNLEGTGAIPIQKLVINCLRMRPDRIVVGECRGGEALDMLQAMNTGHDGSLTTVHSNSPRDCIARLETLVLMAGMDLPAKAIREQIASAVHVIIQQARLVDGSRKVTHITEVCGIEGSTVTLQDIFLFVQTGFDEDGKVTGFHTATGNIPTFVHELRRRGIKIDMGMFKPEPEYAGADFD